MNEWMNLHRKNGKEEDFELNLQKVEIIKELKKVQVLFLPNLIGISPKISYCISFLSIVTSVHFFFFLEINRSILTKKFFRNRSIKIEGKEHKNNPPYTHFSREKKKRKIANQKFVRRGQKTEISRAAKISLISLTNLFDRRQWKRPPRVPPPLSSRFRPFPFYLDPSKRRCYQAGMAAPGE